MRLVLTVLLLAAACGRERTPPPPPQLLQGADRTLGEIEQAVAAGDTLRATTLCRDLEQAILALRGNPDRAAMKAVRRWDDQCAPRLETP